MPEDGEKDGGGEVTYSLTAINKSADMFEQWGDAVLRSLNGLNGMTIKPGDFPAATVLKGIVDDRIKTLTGNVTNLGNSFKFIGTRLREVGKDYEKTEDKNKDDADRIDPIYDGVNDITNQPAPGAGGGAA